MTSEQLRRALSAKVERADEIKSLTSEEFTEEAKQKDATVTNFDAEAPHMETSNLRVYRQRCVKLSRSQQPRKLIESLISRSLSGHEAQHQTSSIQLRLKKVLYLNTGAQSGSRLQDEYRKKVKGLRIYSLRNAKTELMGGNAEEGEALWHNRVWWPGLVSF